MNQSSETENILTWHSYFIVYYFYLFNTNMDIIFLRFKNSIKINVYRVESFVYKIAEYVVV